MHLSGSNRWWTWQNSPGGAVSFTDVPIIPPTSASLSEGSAQLSPSVSNHRLSPLCPFGFVSCRTDISPENTLWVGAWWIGFLGAGAASLLISIPILGYPQRLPGSQRYIVMRVSEAHQLKDGSHKKASDPDFGKTVKDLPRSVLLLLKNPTFIFLCLAGATEATLIAGMSTFGPKFLESQFSLSASEAATLFGYLVVPAGGGGTFLGGFLVNKFKLRCSGIIKLCLLCTVSSLLAIFIFFIHCISR